MAKGHSFNAGWAGMLLLGIGLLTAGQLVAQDIPSHPRKGSVIIDDTTKQVYGPTTSRFLDEQEVFLNREYRHPIDTVIHDFHKFTPVEKRANMYQDLGNIGTAIQPIYFQSPETIGASSGFDVYDLYWQNDSPRYFDTRSPYSNLNMVLGGNGRTITNIIFSRNINPRWNFGFDYRGLYIDKLVQRAAKGDRNVNRTYYDLFTTFASKDSIYRVFFNARLATHVVYEYGGIFVEEDSTLSNFFGENALPELTRAKSYDFRNSLHLYQQLKLAQSLQLYHRITTNYQRATFTDDLVNDEPDYYDFVEIDSAYNEDITKFATLVNEGGVKGSISKLYYNGYVLLRNYRLDYNLVDEQQLALKTRGEELYLGGRVALYLDSLLTLKGGLQYLPTDKYKIEGSLTSDWFEVNASRAVYRPSYFFEFYLGSHDYWFNDFVNTQATSLQGKLKIHGKRFYVHPGLTFNLVKDLIFMKKGDYDGSNSLSGAGQTVLPVQTDGYQTQASPSLQVGLEILPHIMLSSRVIYTRMLENAGNAFQIPELFVNGELSYANIFFEGNLDMQAGIDFHWHSDYYAPAYDVATRHFYVQEDFKVPSFPLTTAFFNFKLRTGRLFVRYYNLTQLITREGYLPTPYYRGQHNIIDFGFDWSFYD